MRTFILWHFYKTVLFPGLVGLKNQKMQKKKSHLVVHMAIRARTTEYSKFIHWISVLAESSPQIQLPQWGCALPKNELIKDASDN